MNLKKQIKMKHKQFKISGILVLFVASIFAQKTDKKFTEQFSTNKDVVVEINASNADIDSGTENTLRAKLEDIREHNLLENAMVTTYTYDPLIGVTSMTDPKGYTIYYEYDEFNRLKQVKDAEGKILSKNEYHYKGQQ